MTCKLWWIPLTADETVVIQGGDSGWWQSHMSEVFFLRFYVGSILWGARQGAGSKPLSRLLNLLEIPLHMRQLWHGFGLCSQLLCLLEQLPKSLCIHTSRQREEESVAKWRQRQYIGSTSKNGWMIQWVIYREINNYLSGDAFFIVMYCTVANFNREWS